MVVQLLGDNIEINENAAGQHAVAIPSTISSVHEVGLEFFRRLPVAERLVVDTEPIAPQLALFSPVAGSEKSWAAKWWRVVWGQQWKAPVEARSKMCLQWSCILRN